jgi:holo-[acyl-carrier protein] synthase
MTRRRGAGKQLSVLGCGVDLVEIAEMGDTLARWSGRFKNRVFLPQEQEYCESKPAAARHYAGRFAVKEAVAKAFGTGVGADLGWLDMEVVRDPQTGAPSVRLSGKGLRLARARGVQQILVSLAHTRHYAVAQVILAGR